jgi:hypothetical protein
MENNIIKRIGELLVNTGEFYEDELPDTHKMALCSDVGKGFISIVFEETHDNSTGMYTVTHCPDYQELQTRYLICAGCIFPDTVPLMVHKSILNHIYEWEDKYTCIMSASLECDWLDEDANRLTDEDIVKRIKELI